MREPLSLDRVRGFFVGRQRQKDRQMSDSWKKRTKLVHGGTRRSQYNEVSEAIFLTQGFVYDTAEQAEARFIETGPDEFIYARYGNPTVAMFEARVKNVTAVCHSLILF
jgi:cystathionine beta-lyase/cystathionine gamma-synthase